MPLSRPTAGAAASSRPAVVKEIAGQLAARTYIQPKGQALLCTAGRRQAGGCRQATTLPSTDALRVTFFALQHPPDTAHTAAAPVPECSPWPAAKEGTSTLWVGEPPGSLQLARVAFELPAGNVGPATTAKGRPSRPTNSASLWVHAVPQPNPAHSPCPTHCTPLISSSRPTTPHSSPLLPTHRHGAPALRRRLCAFLWEVCVSEQLLVDLGLVVQHGRVQQRLRG